MKQTRPPHITRRGFLQHGAPFVAATVCAITAQGEPSGMNRQIGCYTRPWAEYDYRVALDAIAEAGFTCAGLMTAKTPNRLVISVATSIEEAGQAGEECRKRGLSVPSAYGGDIPSHESVAAGIGGMHTLIDNCVAAGVSNLMMGGVATEELAGPYYKAIAESCDYAAEKGIGISLKPHGGTNATGPQCRKIVESVGHRNFGVWYDPGNIFYYSDGSLDPVDDAASVDGLVVGMSVKDYRDPKVVELTPGTGQVDFQRVMSRLIQGGFRTGPLIVECLSPGPLEHLLVEAKKARRFLEELVTTTEPA